MKSSEALIRLTRVFEEENIPYMFVGALSSNIYGVARSTKDADLVIQLSPNQLIPLTRKLGSGFRLEEQATFETLTGTTRNILRVEKSHYTIELFFLSQDPHDQTRFKRRLRIFSPDIGHDVFVPTAEDVIIMKLRWARSKDKDDVRDVLAVQGSKLDWSYIREWTRKHSTEQLLNEIKASLPPGLED